MPALIIHHYDGARCEQACDAPATVTAIRASGEQEVCGGCAHRLWPHEYAEAQAEHEALALAAMLARVERDLLMERGIGVTA